MTEYTPKYDLSSVTRLLNAVKGGNHTLAVLIEDRATIDSAVDEALSSLNSRVVRALSLVYGLPRSEPLTYRAAGEVFYDGTFQNLQMKTRKITLGKDDKNLQNIAEQYCLKPEYIIIGGEIKIKIGIPQDKTAISGTAVAFYVRQGLMRLRHPSRMAYLDKILKIASESTDARMSGVTS